MRGCLFVAEASRAQGARAVPRQEREAPVLQQGCARHLALAPPQPGSVFKKPGRKAYSAPKNLPDTLLTRIEHVLVFLDDLRVPFTTNQTERDLRILKIQQKVPQ